MKLHKDEKIHNIIQDSDITLSESYSGKTLSEVLGEQKNELDKLKSNVKWLAKYGGVGGSGGSGSGSGSTKTKIDVNITYTDTTNQVKSASVKKGQKYIIQKDTKVTLRISLKQGQPGVYKVIITIGNKVTESSFDAMQLGITRVIEVPENSPIKVQVFQVPQDQATLDFYIYSVVKTFKSYFLDFEGYALSNGSVFYDSYIEAPKSKLFIQLINYLDESEFKSQIDSILINDVPLHEIVPEDKLQEVVETDTAGVTYRTIAIESKYIFGNESKTGKKSYGIYTLKANHSYGKEILQPQEEQVTTYIYKDSGMFVYCYSNTEPFIYTNQQTNPNKTSNNFLEKVKYIIYGASSDDLTQTYKITYTVNKEGLESKEYTQQGVRANVDNYITIDNNYAEEDFQNDPIKEIKIIIKVEANNNSNTFNYYFYVTKPDPLSFVFYSKENNTFYYQSSYLDTFSNLNGFSNSIFPFEGGVYSLDKETTFELPKSTNKAWLCANSTSEECKNVIDFITGKYTLNTNGNNGDFIFSFGLRYQNINFDDPIITINFSNDKIIRLYKKKIEYGSKTNVSTYSRWTIPSYDEDGDTNYHLIQIYFKPYYDVNGGTVKGLDTLKLTSSFIVCIDGIFETQVLNMGEAYINQNTSITYHKGLWDYNYISLMSFNAYKTNEPNLQSIVRRYKYDFDPVIPANFFQTFCGLENTPALESTFDSGIYDTLYSLDSGINYYSFTEQITKKNDEGVEEVISTQNTTVDKFIKLNELGTLSKLSTLPIYIIRPKTKDKYINQLLYNTFTSYSENAEIPEFDCDLLIYENNTATVFTPNTDVNFKIKYQGSSTLLYSVKNFEISCSEKTDKEDSDNVYTYYWTPDKTKFQPENSFTLKCDTVDSSSANNTVTGKFVNEYMANSSFKTIANTKTCLEGFPILLIMQDVCEAKTEQPYIFLGIYNFNLGRNSVMNLGYQQILYDTLEESANIDTYNNDKASIYKIYPKNNIKYPVSYRVAEVQGNSLLLYDFSQMDRGLLSSELFGDFYNYSGNMPNRDFNSDVINPIKTLRAYIAENICGVTRLNDLISEPFNEGELQSVSKTPEDAQNLNKYVEVYSHSNAKFYILKIKDTAPSDIENVTGFQYYNNSGVLQDIPNGSKIFNSDTIDSINPYTLKHKNLTVINNPFYQFHVVYKNNTIYKDTNNKKYYYLREDQSLTVSNEAADIFDYDTLLRYYIICMSFALVDSVQKNLTVRCENYKQNQRNLWLTGFYDMDTSFGVDNAGNPVDFKAFSDYIQSDGTIVQDFVNLGLPHSDGGVYDAPSTFLFLWAKYGNILKMQETYSNYTGTEVLKTPYNYWLDLRLKSVNGSTLPCQGAFYNVNEFYERYINSYFGDINPLIWNLNYMYKYFSASLNTDEKNKESSFFNGTRKFIKKEWLKQRFNLLDVLFGIRNNSSIGKSAYKICAQTTNTATSSDIAFPKSNNMAINEEMFPKFTKQSTPITGDINVPELTTEPKTPMVLQTSTSKYALYIANDQGKITNIRGNISSNTDCGFFGSKAVQVLNNCTPFLRASVNANEIQNNIIKVINIADYKDKKDITLNLENLTTVESIYISGSNIGTLTILGSTLNKNLTTLSIVNSTIATLTIQGNSGADMLTINDLTLQNNIITEFNSSDVIIKKHIISENKIAKYSLIGYFKSLTITDNNCKDFALTNYSEEKATLSLTGASIQEITLKQNIKEVTLNCIACTQITTENLDCNSFKVSGADITDLTLSLSGNNNSLIFSVDVCTSLKNLQINNQNLKVLTYPTGAFRDVPLETYLINGKNLNDSSLSTITIELNGSQIFRGTKKPICCIPQSTGVKYKCINKDISNLYQNNGEITIEHVISFFTNTTKSTNITSIDGSYLFLNCQNIKVYPKITEELTTSADTYEPGAYTIPDSFYNLKSSIKKSPLKNISLKGIFGHTDMTILDKEFIELLIIKLNNKNYLYTSTSCTHNNSDTASGKAYLIYNEAECPFENVDVLSIAAASEGQISLQGHSRLVLLTPIPGTENKVNICRNYDINRLLGDKVKAIINLNLFTNRFIQCDCSNGLPKNIQCLEKFIYFGSGGVDNFNKLENLFNNLSQEAIVDISSFFRRSSNPGSIKEINLKNLLLNTNNKFKCKFVVTDTSSYIKGNTIGEEEFGHNIPSSGYIEGEYLYFDKTITANEFKNIMNALKELQIAKLNDNSYTGFLGNKSNGDFFNYHDSLFENISYLFNCCTITNVSSFEDLMSYTPPEKYKPIIHYQKNEDSTFTKTFANVLTYFDPLIKYIENDDEILPEVKVNFTVLEGLFKNCKLVSQSSQNVPFDLNKVWTNLNYLNNKARIISLSKAFHSTRIKYINESFWIQGVRQMVTTFYNCSYENRNVSTQNRINVLTGQFGGGYQWTSENDLLIPDNFFDFCYQAKISSCFASGWNGQTECTNQLIGRIQPTPTEGSTCAWWSDDTKILLETATSLFTNACLIPNKVQNIKAKECYCLYPKWYVDLFKGGYSYKHFTLFSTIKNIELYIFPENSVITPGQKLPRIPQLQSGTTYFINRLNSAYVNKQGGLIWLTIKDGVLSNTITLEGTTDTLKKIFAQNLLSIIEYQQDIILFNTPYSNVSDIKPISEDNRDDSPIVRASITDHDPFYIGYAADPSTKKSQDVHAYCTNTSQQILINNYIQ